ATIRNCPHALERGQPDPSPGYSDAAPGRGPHAAGGVACRAGPPHGQAVASRGRRRTRRPVEGLARRVGSRLKVPGRGWLERSVDPMAALACAVSTAEWDALRSPVAV